MRNAIHFVLQAKGGIGKSLVASILAQHVASKSHSPLFLDLDQENPTFSQYEKIGARQIVVMDGNYVIDPKGFDALMMEVIDHAGPVVVDTGANTFSSLMAYIVENGVFELLRENGKEVVVHTIVGGGDTFFDTICGFDDIAKFVDVPMVLWQNKFFGQMVSPQGKPIEETTIFLSHVDKLAGIVVLDKHSAAFEADIKKMNQHRLTYDEVMAGTMFNLMEKNRIKRVFTGVTAQLDDLPVWG